MQNDDRYSLIRHLMEFADKLLLSTNKPKEPGVPKTGPNAPKVSLSIVDYISADDRKARLLPISFLLYPFIFYSLWRYQATQIISLFGNWWSPLLMWVVLGFLFWALTPFSAFEDSVGRKLLNFVYIITILVFIIFVAIKMSTDEDSAHLFKSYPLRTSKKTSAIYKDFNQLPLALNEKSDYSKSTPETICNYVCFPIHG